MFDLYQFINTLYPAALGALIIKLLDLLVDRYRKGQSLREQKVDRLLEYLDEYGELSQLYSFFTRYSTEIVTDDSGNFLKDESGNWVRKIEILEPDSVLAASFSTLKDTDIWNFINQKVITMRLESANILDIADELDKSKSLRDKFIELHIKSVIDIEKILKNKDKMSPDVAFTQMFNATKEANICRGDLRKEITRFRK